MRLEQIPGKVEPIRDPGDPLVPDQPIRDPIPGRPPAEAPPSRPPGEQPPGRPPAEDPPKPGDPPPIKAA
jgi:hypothetical protein